MIFNGRGEVFAFDRNDNVVLSGEVTVFAKTPSELKLSSDWKSVFGEIDVNFSNKNAGECTRLVFKIPVYDELTLEEVGKVIATLNNAGQVSPSNGLWGYRTEDKPKFGTVDIVSYN